MIYKQLQDGLNNNGRSLGIDAYDAINAIVTILDENGRIVFFNNSSEQLMGYCREEVLGKYVWDVFILPEQMEAVKLVFDHLESNAGNSVYDNYWLTKSGSKILIRWNNSSVLNEAGKVAYIIATGTDITKLNQLQSELIQAKESAEQADQAKSEFLTNMSHELRTPLNAILGFSQLLQFDQGLKSIQKANLNEIFQAGQHLLELINDVLDLAKIESGCNNLQMNAINTDSLLDECMNLMNPVAELSGIALNSNIQKGIAIWGDRVRLKQVILNLISNAIKYNYKNGLVKVEVSSNDNYALIAIKDNGKGIASENLSGLFKPFNRLGAETSEIEGTGIGLTISHTIIKKMGGQLKVNSRFNIGSTFSFEIPICSSDKIELQKSEFISTSISDNSKVRYTLLYIEDNPANQRLVRQTLSTRNDIDLLEADTPQLGIELALFHRPDLILLDINMPKMTGFEVIERLQNSEKINCPPVIAVSANAMKQDITEAKSAGFYDYITKPIDIQNFLNVINRCLSDCQEL